MELELEMPSLHSLREQGLLNEEQTQELAAWFRASCNSPQPLDLPDPLYQALMQALALDNLDVERATRH